MFKKDGGPAFARAAYYGGRIVDQGADGMSLRDYFAGQALAALVPANTPALVLAGAAYAIADAMLAARDV